MFRGLVALTTLTLASLASADTISLRADVWYPMNGDPGSDHPGYMIEIAKAIFGAAGHQVDYDTLPWERTLVMVRNGKFDCAVGAYKDDAPDFVFPEQSLGTDQSFFYVKPTDSWRYQNQDSLKGRHIGLIGGYAYDEDFTKYVEGHKGEIDIQTVNADNALEQNVKKLLAGRIDTLVESPPVLTAKLAEMKLDGKLIEAGAMTEPKPMYIACSPAKPSSKTYVKLLDEGITKLRASGELAKILARYGLKDWQ